MLMATWPRGTRTHSITIGRVLYTSGDSTPGQKHESHVPVQVCAAQSTYARSLTSL